MKRFRESREISVCVGLSRKFAWPWSLQMALHEKSSCCGVKLPHGLRSTSENHSHLTQSAAASIHATWISVTQGESYQFYAVGFSGPELISDSQKHSGKVCCAQMSPHFNLLLGKNGCRVFSPNDQRNHPDFHQWQMQKHTSVMVWWCSRANSMGDWNMC